MAKINLIISLFYLVAFSANAQFSTSNTAPYNSATYLINNVFAGGQVNTSNITTYGTSSQIGFFTGNATLGLDSGIVLSTSTINELCDGICPDASILPANPGNTNGTTFGFPWMGAATGSDTNNNLFNVSASVPGLLGFGDSISNVNDAAAISFDFVPTTDTMRFRFIFASSEWPLYPCSQYNDVFGFFVSGPGISGSYFSPAGYPNGAENYALVPGTSIPITITSINAPGYTASGCTNSNASLFVPNAPLSSGISCHYTTVIEVEFPTQACQTYNFTMAIADGSDGTLASYVMMEANSFVSAGTQMTLNSSYNGGGDSITYEGCGTSDLVISRGTNFQFADTVHFNISGDATNGVDCTQLADSIIFQPGQTTYTQTLQFHNDNIIEGPETLRVFVTDTNFISCAGAGDTALIIIHDPLPLVSNATIDTITCNEDSVLLTTGATGLAPFTVNWSTNFSGDPLVIQPIPTTNTNYTVTIIDACNTDTIFDTAQIFFSNPPFTIDLLNDTINCTTNGINLSPVMTNSTSSFSYQWSNGDTGQVIYVSPNVTTTYSVTATDGCGIRSLSDSATIFLVNQPFSVFAPNKTFFCIGDTVSLDAIATGGYPPFSYLWSDGSTTNNTIITTNSSNSNLTISVTDQCSGDTVVNQVSAILTSYPPLRIDTLIGDTFNCPGTKIALGNTAVHGGSSHSTVSWNNWINTNNFLTSQIDTTVTFTLQATDICTDDTVTSSVTYAVREHYPLWVQAPKDTIICQQELVNLKAIAYDGAGNYSYKWSSGETKSEINSQTNSSQFYEVTVTDDCGETATDDVEITISTVSAEFEHLFYDANRVTFKNLSENAITYLWNFGDDDTTSTVFEPLKVYKYSNEYDVLLIATDSVGCSDSSYHEVSPPLVAFVPNAFTPNGDQLNDTFKIYGQGFYTGSELKEFSVEIYNRWGALIFSSKSHDFEWDGTFKGEKVQNGSYVYKMTVQGFQQQKVEMTGIINVID